MTQLKRLALVSGLVFVGFANSASASDCVQLDGKYFLNGALVDKSKCKSPKAMKRVTEWKGIHTDRCEGKPKGHTYLAIGPDGKRMAQFRCR